MSNSQVNSEPKYAFLHDLNLDQDVVYRLSLHLDRIVSGSSDVYLTPLGKDNDVQSILKGWDEIFNNNKHKLNSELIDLENSNRINSVLGLSPNLGKIG